MSKIRLILKIASILLCSVILLYMAITVPFIDDDNNSCISFIPLVILICLVIGMSVNYIVVYHDLKRTNYEKSITSLTDFERFKLRTEGRLEKWQILYPVFILIGVLELLGYFFRDIGAYSYMTALSGGEIYYYDVEVIIFSVILGNCAAYAFNSLLYLLFWIVFAGLKAHILRDMKVRYYDTLSEDCDINTFMEV